MVRHALTMFLLVQSLHSDSDRCVKTLYLKRISTETAFFYSFSVQAQLLLWNVLPKCFWNSKFVLTLGQCAEIVLKRSNLCNHVYVKCTINKEALGKSHAPNNFHLEIPRLLMDVAKANYIWQRRLRPTRTSLDDIFESKTQFSSLLNLPSLVPVLSG